MVKSYFYLLLILAISCQEIPQAEKAHAGKQTNNLIKDIDLLAKFSETYKPTHIDLSKEPGINNFDLKHILYGEEFREEKELKDYICNLILLKQYLYHLKTANQGYDLLQMRKNQARFLIDYYLKSENIKTDLEMLNSGYPYDHLLPFEAEEDKQIQTLIGEITKESQRIQHQ